MGILFCVRVQLKVAWDRDLLESFAANDGIDYSALVEFEVLDKDAIGFGTYNFVCEFSKVRQSSVVKPTNSTLKLSCRLFFTSFVIIYEKKY